MHLSFPIFRLKRRARLLARQKDIPLNSALDEIARAEGFRAWSHLAQTQSQGASVSALLAACQPGDIILLAGRPGHGKTRLALDLLQSAKDVGRAGYFFTLEYSEADLPKSTDGLFVDMSDDICADHILKTLADAPSGAIIAIDYLQLLDQRRIFPALTEQMTALKRFAATRKVTFVVLSQIDRRFEAKQANLPGFEDIRLPNPLDMGLITKACFLHDGQARLATP